jgi:hypothetical protein
LLLSKIIDYLGCGYIHKSSTRPNEAEFVLYKFSDIYPEAMSRKNSTTLACPAFFLFAPFLPLTVRGGEKKGGKKIFKNYPPPSPPSLGGEGGIQGGKLLVGS